MSIRFASAAAVAACAAMVAAPVSAVELPRTQPVAATEPVGIFDSDAVNAHGHRRWYGRNRVDAGDVIGGILVLGTIAAVASAASRAGDRNRDYRDRDYRNRDYDLNRGYRARPSDSRWDDSRGLDRVVDMCAREVERNAQIDTVDSANRSATGWDVSGRLRTGESFRCSIGNDGRIDGVDYGRGFERRGDASGATADGQWSDDRYAAARSAQEPAPAYPGGPLPGEDAPATGGDDGRYQTSQAPDFPG